MATIKDCVDLLNFLLEKDYEVAFNLIETRYKINEILDKSETDICIKDDLDGPTLGMLGFLQGLFYNQDELIAAVYDDQSKLIRFEVRKR